jgi:cell fate regulator YaaT (PSP1 superfamily)
MTEDNIDNYSYDGNGNDKHRCKDYSKIYIGETFEKIQTSTLCDKYNKYIDSFLVNKFFVTDIKNNLDEAVVSQYAEVGFKGQRKKIFRNDNKLPLMDLEFVVVELENGVDIGTVLCTGDNALDKFRTIYKSEEPGFTILRHPNGEDFDRFRRNRLDEPRVVCKCKELVAHFQLNMKVTDAEWQFDRQKLTIFFTAPIRIDFRDMVKELARLFKTRIELRQISTREEAKRIGGIGPCGRSICCSSWVREFCHVTLDHAKTQQLSNNVAKLSGFCSRLKCCLLYELDTYLEEFKHYPPLNYRVELPEGISKIVKIDIFKHLVYLIPENHQPFKVLTRKEMEALTTAGKVFPPPEGEIVHYPSLDPFFMGTEEDLENIADLEEY